MYIHIYGTFKQETIPVLHPVTRDKLIVLDFIKFY